MHDRKQAVWIPAEPDESQPAPSGPDMLVLPMYAPDAEPAVFSRTIPPQVGDVVEVKGSLMRVVEVGACTLRLDRKPEPHVLRPVPPVPHVTLRERARPPAIVSRPGRPTRWRR